MKHRLIKWISGITLGAVLALGVSAGVNDAKVIKAEDADVKTVNITSSKIKAAIGNSYSNYSFTIDGISFGSKNLCYQGSSGSEYFQVKGNTQNGFWTTSTFEDYYISSVSMTVSSNAGKIGLGSTSDISILSDLPLGSYSENYTESNNYSYLKIMSASSTLQIKNLKIVYTAKTGEIAPPEEGDYALVKDASNLQTGDEIILGVKSKGVAAGAFNSKSLTGVAATFVGETLASQDANVLTLSKTENGFKMLSSEGYVGTTVVKELALETETEWTISIDSDSGKATIEASGLGHMMYNCNGTSIFRNYASDESAFMFLPEIYLNTKTVVANYTVIYDGNGHTGTMVDSNSPYVKTSEVTVLANGFDSKTGETFKEWNTKADGTGTSYQPNDKFGITGNVTLYAIWEAEYIPVGDTFTKVTSVSALSDGDKFLFAYRSGNTTKVNGSLEGSDHFTAYDANIVNDELSYINEKVTPLTLVKEGSDFYIQLNSNYLTITADSSNKLAWKTKDKANKWSISFNDGNAKVTTSFNTTSHSIFYNGSGTGRFSNYSSNTMSPIELWAKSGHAKEVVLDKTTVDLNVEQTTTLKVQECLGFTPTSYAWEVTTGSEFVEIAAGQGTNEITLKGLAEGEAEVYVTVDGAKAKAIVSVHDYKYNLLIKDSYFITVNGAMMTKDKAYLTDVDFSEDNMWSFEKAYLGDNSYYLVSSAGYLSFSEDVLTDGKNVSELEITATPINVWVVSYSEGNGYKVTTQTTTQGVRSLATHEEKWYAFTGNYYVNLVEAGTFDHIEVKALPTTKQYFVGDDLKPLNAHVYAVYTNGFEVEITSKIVWDKLVEGTKATGKVTVGGQERTVEMDGIKVFKGDASTFGITGLEDTYPAGEKIKKELLSVSIAYRLAGEEPIIKTLTKDDFVISPERILEDTTKIRISLAKDPTVYYEKEIEVKASPYVATNYVGVGDRIVIGTLGYDPYDLTGGTELSYTDRFYYSDFGSLPRGDMVFEVGKEGSYYTLKDTETGYYLKGDNSAFTFNMPDLKSVYAEGDGHYEFNMPVTIGGTSYLVTMKTDPNPDFDYTNVLYSYDTINDGYTDYINGISDLENDKIIFNSYIGGVYTEAAAEVNLASWSFENNVFQYALETSSTLPDECLFTMAYDEDNEQWDISSKSHQDKQLYYNKDGKFGFYAIGSSYTPIMLFRDNELPLQSEVQSLSVSFQEGMNEVTVGEQFPWTSALIVKAHYAGGANKIVPVGGYEITQMPDTSKIGSATGVISYGQNGHKITKEFTITVKGKTQAFDVVCKDPILVGETYQAHLDNKYTPPEGEPIRWSVSDETLASIDQEGNVTGLAPGYVDVIATSFDGTYSDFEHIRIFQQVTSVTLNKDTAEVNAGETVQLSATVLPANASNTKVTYSSSDPTVAYVDVNTGLVTGVKPGTATITCAAQNHPEDNFDTCVITVKEAPVVHVTGITLDCDYKEIEVKGTFKLTATISPSNATVKNVTWSSDHENIATVDQNGNVKGVAKGECTITATTADGGKTASCTIKVKATAVDVHVTSVSLDKTNVSLKVGETETLIATVAPGNANNKSVTWSSSNSSVATVTNGVVKAIGEGTATITVTTTDGGKTATALVTVTKDSGTGGGEGTGTGGGETTGGGTETGGGTTTGGGSTGGETNSTFNKLNIFGCFGSVTATTMIISLASLAGAGLLLSKKKRK